MFKIGDKTRVKTREEIRKTLDDLGECRGVPFNGWIEKICGREVMLESPLDTKADFLADGYYEVVEEWLEPCKEKFTSAKFEIEENVIEPKAFIENCQTRKTKEDKNESKNKKETSKKETGCVVEITGFSFEELKKIFGDRVKIIETPARSIEKIMEDLRKGEYSSIDFTKNNNTILAIVWMADGTAKTGYARRAPDDLNNEEAGRALALARALNRKDIEKELLAFM